MSVSRRVIHHGLYFAVLGPLIGVLFLVLYIFFAKEPLVLLVIIQVLPLFLLLSITTGAIPALLTGVMVACLPEKIGSQKNYRCLAGGIGGVVITEIYTLSLHDALPISVNNAGIAPVVIDNKRNNGSTCIITKRTSGSFAKNM